MTERQSPKTFYTATKILYILLLCASVVSASVFASNADLPELPSLEVEAKEIDQTLKNLDQQLENKDLGATSQPQTPNVPLPVSAELPKAEEVKPEQKDAPAQEAPEIKMLPKVDKQQELSPQEALPQLPVMPLPEASPAAPSQKPEAVKVEVPVTATVPAEPLQSKPVATPTEALPAPVAVPQISVPAKIPEPDSPPVPAAILQTPAPIESPVPIPTPTPAPVDKFAEDEAKVLLLPNDEVVLGKLDPDAKLEQFSFNSYLALYRKVYDHIYDSPEEVAMKNFLNRYYANSTPSELGRQALSLATDAAAHGDIASLKVLIDNYNVLQRMDANGNSVIQSAVSSGEYLSTKYLLLRGANMYFINTRGETAAMIAGRLHDDKIENLLFKARQ